MGGSGRDKGWRETPSVDAARLGGVEKLPDRPAGRDLLQETVKVLYDTWSMICFNDDDLHESM